VKTKAWLVRIKHVVIKVKATEKKCDNRAGVRLKGERRASMEMMASGRPKLLEHHRAQDALTRNRLQRRARNGRQRQSKSPMDFVVSRLVG